jgi:hypothetical protein
MISWSGSTPAASNPTWTLWCAQVWRISGLSRFIPLMTAMVD